jgi:integrase
MKAKRASLQVEHSRCCPHKGKTSLDSVTVGCRRSGCRPSYYTLRRDPSGKRIRGEAFVDLDGNRVDGGRYTDKQTAQRVLEKLQRVLDSGRAGVAAAKSVTLPEWVDEFEQILANSVRKGDLKPRSEREYMDSLRRAKASIGYVDLRQIADADLRRLDDSLAPCSPATRARHLKHLSLALSAAIGEGYLEGNPVGPFKKRLNLGKRIPRRGKAPFEEGELARLWPAYSEVRNGRNEPVYRYMAEFSVETGLRIGELAALDWQNVRGSLDRVRVEHTYNDIDGLVAPKDGEARVIYLPPFARAVLEAWIGVCGVCESGPVFPAPDGGRISIRNAQRRLDAAMRKAGIPKVHPEMRLPRSFHSLRYTTSVLLQRRGFHPRYIEQMLGHGTLELSLNLYGHWTPEQLAAEAAVPSFAVTAVPMAEGV